MLLVILFVELIILELVIVEPITNAIVDLNL